MRRELPYYATGCSAACLYLLALYQALDAHLTVPQPALPLPPPPLPTCGAVAVVDQIMCCCRMQVGLIASLKNEYKHDIVEKVRARLASWRAMQHDTGPSPACMPVFRSAGSPSCCSVQQI